MPYQYVKRAESIKAKSALLSKVLIILVCLSRSGGLQASTEILNNTGEEKESLLVGENHLSVQVEFGGETQYITEGRDQLDDGGIIWGEMVMEYASIHLYSSLGQASRQNYREWQLGISYDVFETETFDGIIGLQFVEIYGDERESDAEFASAVAYRGIGWVTVSIDHTYSLQSNGHFIELSLHGKSVELAGKGLVTPYVSQAFDFQFANEEYNGANHVQFGIEARYPLSQKLSLSGHMSHVIPQGGIKRDVSFEAKQQTFAGVSISLQF
ncbi:hypothetical protein FM037_11430 [Shewanella psychropiezotolerans]|uniref:Copper resistance protein B n=1 Tax=Shewanella psychropiezotolerans TaxID=2593655 RepID=A0ABX5WZ83_9GAMM|nr:hypothetical protein [Shewanella psychropiezotolerans]QDO83732.1 hypothetical protein FM037_11430 [Shewanella psychropiezotolerans]